MPNALPKTTPKQPLEKQPTETNAMKQGFRRSPLALTLGMLLVLEGVITALINWQIVSAAPLWLLLLILITLSTLIFWARNVLPWALRVATFGLVSLMLIQCAGAQWLVMLLFSGAAALLLNFMHLPQQWWIFSLAGIVYSGAFQLYLYQLHPAWHRAAIFYFGLAFNFALLYLFPPAWGGRRWALYPALSSLLLTWLTNAPNFRESPVLALFFVTLGLMILSVSRRLRKLAAK